MYVPNFPVRAHDAVGQVKRFALFDAFIVQVEYLLGIILMEILVVVTYIWVVLSWFQSKDAIGLFRPDCFAAGSINIVIAKVGISFGFLQFGFIFHQRALRLFAFGDIQRHG